MTIDELGRSAGIEVLSRSTSELDIDASLGDLYRQMRRRQRVRTGAAILAAAAVAGVLAVAFRSGLDLTRSEPAQPAQTTTEDVATAPSMNACGLPFVTCRAGSPSRIEMRAPLTWNLPHGFGSALYYTTDRSGDRLVSVESYRIDGNPDLASGVTVAEDVAAARQTRIPAADETVGAGAEELAEWLASRPYLRASKVSSGMVGEHPAWTVEVTLADARDPGPARCTHHRFPCTPVLYLQGADSPPVHGIFGQMKSRYTFVDVPGTGVAAIWSWTFGKETVLDKNQELVDSIAFGAPDG